MLFQKYLCQQNLVLETFGSTKMQFPKRNQSNKNWVKKVQGEKVCRPKQKNVGPQTNLCLKNIWVNKIVGPEDIGPGYMGQNVSPKKLGQTNILVIKNVGPKNVGPKNVGPQMWVPKVWI